MHKILTSRNFLEKSNGLCIQKRVKPQNITWWWHSFGDTRGLKPSNKSGSEFKKKMIGKPSFKTHVGQLKHQQDSLHNQKLKWLKIFFEIVLQPSLKTCELIYIKKQQRYNTRWKRLFRWLINAS